MHVCVYSGNVLIKMTLQHVVHLCCNLRYWKVTEFNLIGYLEVLYCKIKS